MSLKSARRSKIKIGLYNLEKHIVNTAMMQVSNYHKNNNDLVEIYNPLFHSEYDLVYAFSIFDLTPKTYIRKEMICGGTGFDIKSKLPPRIEACDYDWSLYPGCDYSIIWFSRGCFRDCKWCVVRPKEGFIKPVLPKNMNPNGKYIKIYDNNFFGNPEWKQSIKWLQEWGQPVDFQGVDVRTLNQEKCEAMLTLKHYKRIHVAWDDPKDDLEPYFKKILQWIKPYRLMCYVLVGYDSTETQDLYRINKLIEFGIDPFVMPYNKKDMYQKDLARWCNKQIIRKSCEWKDYDKKR